MEKTNRKAIREQIREMVERQSDKDSIEVWFWAKEGTYKWFNLIVRLSGSLPFLTARALNLGMKEGWSAIDIEDITEIGNEIEKPK